MIFRQLFDHESCTYTYLLAARTGGEALIIDPVRRFMPEYVRLIQELNVQLVFAIDTHLHADHITATGPLREAYDCAVVMGEQTKAEIVNRRVTEGELLQVDSLKLRTLYTPGHTDDSYSFVGEDRVFTGDTLLIRGTGRTDFQNGDPRAQFESIFEKLLQLPEDMLIYPAHDYRGQTVSTIGEERAHNPRLQVTSVDDYVEIMNNLQLAHPQQMDVAIPANLRCGIEEEVAASAI